MDISVIIPARNERHFIAQGLLGLHTQDFPGKYEVIVVDNGSDDGTGDFARVWSRLALVKVVEEPVRGVQRARERGRLEAQGNILAFLDADTIPSRSWLQNGFRHFHDQAVVAVTGSYNFYDSGPVLAFGATVVSKFIYPSMLWLVREVFGSGIMIGGNCFIRKAALEDIGGFNTDIEFWGDDTDTAVRLSQVGRIVYGKDVFAWTSARRYHEQGVLKTLWGYTFHAARISARSLHERKPILHTTSRS